MCYCKNDAGELDGIEAAKDKIEMKALIEKKAQTEASVDVNLDNASFEFSNGDTT